MAGSAATDQGRGSKAAPSSGASAGAGSRGGGSGSTQDPLLQRLAQCATATQLHQLLLRHSAELGGHEVAVALKVAAERKMLQTAEAEAATAEGEAANGTGNGRGGPLAPLLVQLAAQHAPNMDPAALSAAAWSLAALQLEPARPAMHAMHAKAAQQLVQHSPAQLCALLWAGGSLEPGYRSPLLQALAGLLKQGMSLALFSANDLTALAWLCGRVSGPCQTVVLPHLRRGMPQLLFPPPPALPQASRAAATAPL